MKSLLPRHLSAGWQLVLLLLLMVVMACVASFFIVSYAYAALHVPLERLGAVLAAPATHPHGWRLTMVSQGILLGVGFGGAALLLPWLLGLRWGEYFAPRRLGAWWWLLAAALLVVLLLPLMSGLVAWNAELHFPPFLQGFEDWARAKEDQAATLTKYLTDFSSTTRFVVGLLVIAVVPAVAEELVFRGVIQRNLINGLGSRHVGIWAAAAIFSAIHLQFFGFFPRLALGLVLGYLYEWSGNSLVPIAGHFMQNAFQLTLLYLVQGRRLPTVFNPDTPDAFAWPAVLASAALGGGLLYLIYRQMALPEAPAEMHTLSSEGVAVVRGGDEPAP